MNLRPLGSAQKPGLTRIEPDLWVDWKEVGHAPSADVRRRPPTSADVRRRPDSLLSLACDLWVMSPTLQARARTSTDEQSCSGTNNLGPMPFLQIIDEVPEFSAADSSTVLPLDFDTTRRLS